MEKDRVNNDVPFVSIITGYYNRTKNLKKSIQSVLNQDYPNFEYIVFDDNSTDDTSNLLKEFDDPRLRLISHDRNLGFTKGMIQAVSVSRGDLIAIHGAGDISFPNRIREQVNLLSSNADLGIIGCLVEDVSEDTTIIINPSKGGDGSMFTGGEVMFRRDAYFRAGGYNSLYYFGQFTPLKAEILKFSKPDFVNEVLYRRIHFSNGVSKNKKKLVEQQILGSVGRDVAKVGLINVDISSIVIEKSLRHIGLIKPKSHEYYTFVAHVKRSKNFLAYILFKLYRYKLIPIRPLQKLASVMRNKRSKYNSKLAK